MHTWNTITKRETGKFSRALFLIETLCHDLSIPIIEYLSENRQASFQELSSAITKENAMLEEQLHKLCETGIVRRDQAISGNDYVLDYKRIATINAISAELAKGK